MRVAASGMRAPTQRTVRASSSSSSIVTARRHDAVHGHAHDESDSAASVSASTAAALPSMVRDIKAMETAGGAREDQIGAAVLTLEHMALLDVETGVREPDRIDTLLHAAERLLTMGLHGVGMHYLRRAAPMLLGMSAGALETLPFSVDSKLSRPIEVAKLALPNDNFVAAPVAGHSFSFPGRSMRVQQIRLLTLLGKGYEQDAQWAQATYFYEQAHVLAARVVGQFHETLVDIYEGLVRVYRTRSEPERALATLVLETDLLMRQLKAARTPDAQVDLRRLLLLAAETRTAILYSSGRFSDAIASAKQALACVEGDSATAAIQQRLVIRIAEMYTVMRRFDAACATLSRIKHPCDEVRERFAWVRELAANLRCITRLPEQLDAAAIAEAAAAADSTAADDSALMALRGGGASSSDIGPGAEQLAPRGRRNSAVRIAPPAARAQAPDALRGNSRATTSAGGAQPRRAPSAHRAPS